ncbi:MAG TPA: hypothetical protein VKN18_31960 [Blastocatellia bacterium]|nr:hypothetical protein [Blastocatellia bacterium]
MNRLFRRIGGFVKRAAPILKTVAKVAAPIIAAAVGVALLAERRAKSGESVGEIEARLR